MVCGLAPSKLLLFHSHILLPARTTFFSACPATVFPVSYVLFPSCAQFHSVLLFILACPVLSCHALPCLAFAFACALCALVSLRPHFYSSLMSPSYLTEFTTGNKCRATCEHAGLQMMLWEVLAVDDCYTATLPKRRPCVAEIHRALP